MNPADEKKESRKLYWWELFLKKYLKYSYFYWSFNFFCSVLDQNVQTDPKLFIFQFYFLWFHYDFFYYNVTFFYTRICAHMFRAYLTHGGPWELPENVQNTTNLNKRIFTNVALLLFYRTDLNRIMNPRWNKDIK